MWAGLVGLVGEMEGNVLDILTLRCSLDIQVWSWQLDLSLELRERSVCKSYLKPQD